MKQYINEYTGEIKTEKEWRNYIDEKHAMAFDNGDALELPEFDEQLEHGELMLFDSLVPMGRRKIKIRRTLKMIDEIFPELNFDYNLKNRYRKLFNIHQLKSELKKVAYKLGWEKVKPIYHKNYLAVGANYTAK